ncbi:serine hydrolase [Rugosimonospora acidiphila]|uniref:Serine hydrolase n=1 Tax=Rugosimonospora acidiphila TaxID=556531 RepID=A0ABP9RHH1_9ACTN
MRTRTLVLLCLVVAAVASVVSVPLAYAGSHSPATPFGTAKTASQPKPPLPTLVIPADPNSIKAPANLDYFGWTLIDRQTGQSAGSANAETTDSTTESMIKAWIAADYLRHHDNPAQSDLDALNSMIIHSDDNIAQTYFVADGGESSIDELVQVCGLKDTHEASGPVAGKWSYTMMSPADAARMGLCIADNKAAGAKWTPWLLTSMKHVVGSVQDQQATTGGGRWGIIDGLPSYLQSSTAMKNGWTAQVYNDDDWHINCLAINTGWVLAIELRYPWTSPDGRWEDADNLAVGANDCAAVTKELVGVPAG